MPSLTRRRDPDSREEAWLISYGDVHVGTIGQRSGNPSGTEPWSWQCDFYPGSNPGDESHGTAADFDAARARIRERLVGLSFETHRSRFSGVSTSPGISWMRKM
jgi:hypothetical protein